MQSHALRRHACTGMHASLWPICGVSVRVGMIIRLRARKEESGLKKKEKEKKNSVLVAYNCIGIDRVLYTTLIHARPRHFQVKFNKKTVSDSCTIHLSAKWEANVYVHCTVYEYREDETKCELKSCRMHVPCHCDLCAQF